MHGWRHTYYAMVSTVTTLKFNICKTDKSFWPFLLSILTGVAPKRSSVVGAHPVIYFMHVSIKFVQWYRKYSTRHSGYRQKQTQAKTLTPAFTLCFLGHKCKKNKQKNNFNRYSFSFWTPPPPRILDSVHRHQAITMFNIIKPSIHLVWSDWFISSLPVTLHTPCLVLMLAKLHSSLKFSAEISSAWAPWGGTTFTALHRDHS